MSDPKKNLRRSRGFLASPRPLSTEPLESRIVLDGTISLDPLSGVLTILGTAFNDQSTVSETSPGELQVTLNALPAERFDRSVVTSLYFSGAAGADLFRNLTDLPAEIYGHKGNDSLYGGTGVDRIYGGQGHDVLEGGAGNDEVDGGIHNDTLRGRDGDDLLVGGDGTDSIYGGLGNDRIHGDRGMDSLFGEGGADTIYGFTENDTISGGPGNDQIYGQHGDDVIDGDGDDDVLGGGPGLDTVNGGSGNDQITGDQDADLLYGDAGDDSLWAWIGDDTLYGGDGNDQLYPQEDHDVVYGGNGNDLILGGTGDDRLHGEGGMDIIHGQEGNDVLRGQAGTDYLFGQAGDDSLLGGAQMGEADTLSGGNGFDRFLELSGDALSSPEPVDARLVFVNVDHTWSEGALEIADTAFARLFAATGNGRLLRESLNSKPLTFYKYANLNGSAGLNMLSWSSQTSCGPGGCTTVYDYTRQIRIAAWDESRPGYNDLMVDVFVHEIGHNWDSATELEAARAGLTTQFNQFLAVADWRSTFPGAGYTQSLDGRWWYRSDAWFQKNYARTNPYEDMATAWEYWFEAWQDPGLDHTNMQPRMNILDSIFAVLA